MFKYQGTREYEVRKPVGRMPRITETGHHFYDYHQNRHIYFRKLGPKKYHFKMFVNGTATTDTESTFEGLRAYVMNNFGFDPQGYKKLIDA